MSLRFEPAGIIPGEALQSSHGFDRSLHAPDIGAAEAAFQSLIYGGFAPVGGLFIKLTSVAMMVTLMPAVLSFSSFIISLAAAMA